MSEPLDFRPVADGLLTGTADAPVLLGSRCRACATVTFPVQVSCPNCTREDTETVPLPREGTLWSWTIQGFAPKAPPYAGDAATFAPYGVGYVELDGQVRVETRLTLADPERLRIGMPMQLTLVPAPGGEEEGTMTYAFRPLGEEVR